MYHEQEGKSIIHVATRFKTYMILEEIIERYRFAAEQKYKKVLSLSDKQAKSTAKKDIKNWVNAKTKCEFEYRAIHFACYHG